MVRQRKVRHVAARVRLRDTIVAAGVRVGPARVHLADRGLGGFGGAAVGGEGLGGVRGGRFGDGAFDEVGLFLAVADGPVAARAADDAHLFEEGRLVPVEAGLGDEAVVEADDVYLHLLVSL